MDNTRILDHVIETLVQVYQGEKSTELLKACIEQLGDAKKINAINAEDIKHKQEQKTVSEPSKLKPGQMVRRKGFLTSPIYVFVERIGINQSLFQCNDSGFFVTVPDLDVSRNFEILGN